MFQSFTALEYLKIDVANNYGLDKEDWDARISWFNIHEFELEKLIKEAENPALYFAGVQAYRNAVQGKPIGYPISLDATASGIQVLSILMGCRKSALTCNVLDSGKREDSYTANYQAMCAKLGDRARIERKDTKRALMTSLYSSVAVPREVFGEGSELLKCFYETVKETMPGAWELNEAMLGTWQKNKLSHDWVLPDNFHVHVKVLNTRVTNVQFMNAPHEVRYAVNEPVEEGRSNGANMVHSIDGMIFREVANRCMMSDFIKSKVIFSLDHNGKSVHREQDKMVMTLWDLYKKSGFLSSRILNYLDSLNMGHVDPEVIKEMLASLPKKSFNVLGVHDCFRVHPNYGNDLRRQYNYILHKIAKSNLLEFIVSQIVGYPVTVKKMDDIADEILEANYALS